VTSYITGYNKDCNVQGSLVKVEAVFRHSEVFRGILGLTKVGTDRKHQLYIV
jgi:hypothetical protein